MGTERTGEPLPRPLVVMDTAGTRDERPGLSGVAPADLGRWFAERQQPGYRARQLSDHLWTASAITADELRTLPAGLRDELARDFRIDTIADSDVRPADAGLTEKVEVKMQGAASGSAM